MYAPSYMVLNLLDLLGSFRSSKFVLLVEGRTTKLWSTVGLSFQRFKAKELNLFLAAPTYVKCQGLPTLSILIGQHWANTKAILLSGL